MGKEFAIKSQEEIDINGHTNPLPINKTEPNNVGPYGDREEYASGSIGALLGGIVGGIAAEAIYLRYKDVKVPRRAVLRELRFFAEAIGLFGTGVVGGGFSGHEIGRTVYKLTKNTEGNK